MKKGNLINRKYNRMLCACLLTWIVAVMADMADSIMAGIFVSENAVSAVELVLPVFSILMFLSTFIAVGSATLFVRYQGQFDKENSNRICGMGLITSIVSGVVMSILMLIFENNFFAFYVSSPEVEILAREYYESLVFVTSVYSVYWLLDYLVSNDGNPFLCTIANVVNIVTNVIASALLINSFGLKGLGYGTVVAFLVSCLILLLHFITHKNSIKFKICFDPKLFGKVLATGSGSSFTYLYLGVVDIIVNKYIVSYFGSAYLAPYAVINLILNLGGCFTCSISAASPFISLAIGEENSLAIRKLTKMITISNIVVCGTFTIIFEVFSPGIPAIFGIKTPELLAPSIYATRVLALSFIMMGYVHNWCTYLPKIKRVILANMIVFIYEFVSPLVFPLLFSRLWGFKGLVWGFFATPFVAGIVYFLIVSVRYGIKKFPYIIDEYDNDVYIYETKIYSGKSVEVCNFTTEFLEKNNINSSLVTEINNVIKTFYEALAKDNNKKTILSDCTLIVNDKYIKVIIRDNGKIFNMAEKYIEIQKIRDEMNNKINDVNVRSTYLVATSFNRNSFVWKCE